GGADHRGDPAWTHLQVHVANCLVVAVEDRQTTNVENGDSRVGGLTVVAVGVGSHTAVGAVLSGGVADRHEVTSRSDGTRDWPCGAVRPMEVCRKEARVNGHGGQSERRWWSGKLRAAARVSRTPPPVRRGSHTCEKAPGQQHKTPRITPRTVPVLRSGCAPLPCPTRGPV